MHIEAVGITDTGSVRDNNEDHFVCDVARGLFAVCDGMGGHAAGEVASHLACEELCLLTDALTLQHLARKDETPSPKILTLLMQHLVEGLEEISQKIISKGLSEGQKRGMGTTCTLLWLVGPHHGLVAHIGDSRLYVQDASGCGTLTVDHTLVEEFVARGLMTPKDAQGHPQAHILSRALGASGGLEADAFAVRVAVGDTFLLCSDGLHHYLPQKPHLGPPWGTGGSASPAGIQEALQAIIDDGNRQGGTDNLTGVLVHLPKQTNASAKAHDTLEPWEVHAARLTTHPALKYVPNAYLRQCAAFIVPVEAQEQAMGAGIFWPTHAPLRVSFAKGPYTEHQGRYFAAEPLGPKGGVPSLYSVQSAAPMYHLAAEHLVTLIKRSAPLGAHLLAGLLAGDTSQR